MNEFLIAISTAIIGGLIGTYSGARFLNMREESKMKEVRAIAIKALDVLKKYSKQSYRNAENDFNTSLSLVEKRTVLVALHKLGIPIGIPSDEEIDKDIASRLRKLHLVEGRYPKLFLSAYTAKTVDDKELKTEYIRNKSFNDLHFKDMILQYLRSFGGATRAELNTLLQSKLSDVLTEEQKIRKIGNMLSALKKQGVIKLTEKKKWVLVEV